MLEYVIQGQAAYAICQMHAWFDRLGVSFVTSRTPSICRIGVVAVVLCGVDARRITVRAETPSCLYQPWVW